MNGFIERKNLHRAIEAVGLAAETEPGVMLDLVGSGPEEARLREVAE